MLAMVLVGLIFLALAVWSVWERLPELERAVVRLQERKEVRMARLQRSIAALQDRMSTLHREAAAAQQRVTLIQAKRGQPAGPSAHGAPRPAPMPEHGETAPSPTPLQG